jgi:hypothetical protein
VGWCSEFGVEIAQCDHPMVAGHDACHCEICAVTCTGRFDGCPDVWKRGPASVELLRPRADRSSPSEIEPGGMTPDIRWPLGPDSVPSVEMYREVLKALRQVEARLEAVEFAIRDSARSTQPQEELVQLLDRLPRRIGEVISETLDQPRAVITPGREARPGRGGPLAAG